MENHTAEDASRGREIFNALIHATPGVLCGNR